jgi:uncharacterized protein
MEIRPEDEEGRDDKEKDDVPETPPDEPRPPRVDDPPPDDRGPYVVHARSEQNREAVVTTGERKERRGFASMSPEKQREIASKGGRAAHEKGTAHEWSAEEARSAGRKGGQVSRGGRGRLAVPPADAAPMTTGQPAGDATSSER